MTEINVGGYVGKVLRVDLSSEKMSHETLASATLRKYLGGTGMGTKYLYEEVPPGVEWNDPENRLMVFSGPLGGTRVNGSGTVSFVSKGAITNLAVTTQANGFLGAYLKFSGFDGVVIKGQAKTWKYLYIHDDTAELRDANHLLGKDTWETQDIITEELGKKCSVFSIGPAGENLVRFSGILGDYGHAAAHNGVGAVMGSKKLKAIVAERGSKTVPIFDPDALIPLARELVENAKKADAMMVQWGTSCAFDLVAKGGMLPIKNYTTSIFANAVDFKGENVRNRYKATKTTCWACSIAHTRMIEVTDGPYKGFKGEEPEYEGMAAMGPMIGQSDPGAAIMLGNLVDRLGFDINETGYMLGWLMECYEKGYIDREKYDGLEMNWGNVESAKEMLKRIAHRQGNATIWAEGVKRASDKIGGEAANCAVTTLKGASPRGHDHRARWSELADTSISNTGTIESGGGIQRPEQLGVPPLLKPFDPIEVSNYNSRMNGRRLFEDSLGICWFPVTDIQLTIKTLNAITGWNFDLTEAMDAGRRFVNQLRVFNFRHGLTKDIEGPSVRYSSAPVDGPAQGITIKPHWETLRRNYYTQMGWDPETGKPLKETLERLGLGDLYKELQVK